MNRPLTLALIAGSLLGCSKSDQPAAPTANEIAQATADVQKSEAVRTRIKGITKLGDSQMKRHEDMVASGKLTDWMKLSEQERAIPFLFVLAGETDNDAELCLAAAIASEQTFVAAGKQQADEATTFARIAELSKSFAPANARMSSRTNDYPKAKVIASLLMRKN